MTPCDSVKSLLRTIESERKKHIKHAVIPVERSPDKVQVNIYLGRRDAAFRIFDLQAGLTVLMQRTIREWFESFLM